MSKNFLIHVLLTVFILLLGNSCAQNNKKSSYNNGMVVTANDLATKIGVQILKKGGNAIDAAVAVGFALAVTYPVAGNIGGGGFMVIHTSDGKDIAIDFREQAPTNAFRDMYLDSAGNFNPLLSQEGVTSSGVPGSVAGLIYALQKYGTMNLSDVIQPAINLAENGFIVSSSLARSFNNYFNYFKKYSSTQKVFLKNGNPFNEGDIFIQKDLAKTLKEIKNKGKDGFYKGKIAKIIVDFIQKNGGYFSLKDLENYQPIERIPIKGSYRGFEIISMPPSSSGGIALIQMLNILENFKIERNDWGSSKHIHRLVETIKRVYADRSVHLGDPAFYNVPVDWLISKEYAKDLFQQINDCATQSICINPGVPYDIKESKETTHYSVYDKYGNAVSVTTTINSGYGSKVIVEGAGFFLNNEMDDFSAKPNTPNQFGLLGSDANSIQPGKRMLSCMTPTIVLKNGKPFLILGTPGGSTIMTVVLQVLMNIIDFNMTIETANRMPRIHHQWFPDKIEYERFALTEDVRNNLQSRGHIIGDEIYLGLVEMILIDPNSKKIFGSSDPRGNGLAEGF